MSLYDLPKDILVKLITIVSQEKDQEKDERIKHLEKILELLKFNEEGLKKFKCYCCSDDFYNDENDYASFDEQGDLCARCDKPFCYNCLSDRNYIGTGGYYICSDCLPNEKTIGDKSIKSFI